MAKKATTKRALVDAGTEAAFEIARTLAESIPLGSRWSEVEHEFVKPSGGDWQYGSITLSSIANGRFDFGVWLDRTTSLESDDIPILCAAFGAHTRADGRALVAMAEAGDVPRQPYDLNQDERLVGFDREPVLDIPSNVDRFLSSYREAGAFEVEPAVRQFRHFWDTWASEVARLVDLPRSLTVRADWTGRALRGLVGELVVLAQRQMSTAKWVGAESEPYDIKLRRLLIEVKTRSGATATLSLRQLRSAKSDRYFVAVVDLPEAAQLALMGAAAGDSKLHPIVVRHRKNLEVYLRHRGVTLEPSMLPAISRAVRLSVVVGWILPAHATRGLLVGHGRARTFRAHRRSRNRLWP